jgi:hypothetical protein
MRVSVVLLLLALLAVRCAAEEDQQEPGPDIEIHQWPEILQQALHGADAAAAGITSFDLTHGLRQLDEVAATMATLHQEIEAVTTRLAAGGTVPEARMQAVCEHARAVRNVLGQLKDALEDRDTATTMKAEPAERAWWDARCAKLVARLQRVDLATPAQDDDGEEAEAAVHRLIVRVHAQVHVMQAQEQAAASVAAQQADDANGDATVAVATGTAGDSVGSGTAPVAATGAAVDATVAAVDATAAAADAPGESATAAQMASGSGVHAYLVQGGDTLAGISKTWYGSARYWRAIVAANPGLDPTALKIGQVLVIPEVGSAPGHAAIGAANAADITTQALTAFDTAAREWLTRLAAWRAGTGERPGDFASSRYEEAMRMGMQADGMEQQAQQYDRDRENAGLPELAAFDRIMATEIADMRRVALLSLVKEDGDPELVAAQAACKNAEETCEGAREAIDQAKERAGIVRHLNELCEKEPRIAGGTLPTRLRALLLRNQAAERAVTEAVVAGATVARIQAQGEMAKATLELQALRAEADDDQELIQVERLFPAASATGAEPVVDARLTACRARAQALADDRAKALAAAIAKQELATRLELLNFKQEALGTASDDAGAAEERSRGLYMADIQALHQAAAAAASPQVEKDKEDALKVPTADPKDGF